MRSFGMRNTNRRGKGRGSGETINLYDSGQKQPEDMLQTIKGAAHRDSDAPLVPYNPPFSEFYNDRFV